MMLGNRLLMAAQTPVPGGEWWQVSGKTCVAAYDAKNAASLANSYVNLANPGTYDLTVVENAPDWASGSGWTFDKTNNEYLDSGYAVGTDRNHTLIGYFDNRPNGDSMCVAGARIASGARIYILPSDGGNANTNYAQGGYYVDAAGPYSNGVLAIAGSSAYLNGSFRGTSSALAGDITYHIWIAAINESDSYTFGYSGDIIAVAIYSDTLSAGEVATLTTAMQAL